MRVTEGVWVLGGGLEFSCMYYVFITKELTVLRKSLMAATSFGIPWQLVIRTQERLLCPLF